MQRRRSSSRLGLVGLVASWCLFCEIATAFASPWQTPKGLATAIASRIRLDASTNGKAGGDDFSELTSALARLDQQWQIQQRSKGGSSRWSKLFLPNDTEANPKEEGAAAGSTSELSEDFVWILEPPSNSIPSCAIVFTGGAGLGQFPHIAYNELLSRVSDRLNAVCIAAPYQVGLDHFGLAKETGERIRRALVYCEDDSSRQYPSNLPTYCLAHSLGCKLQTIYLAATGQEFEGIGFMSFNNFSFGKTISMARNFAAEIRKSSQGSQFSTNGLENEEILNSIFNFAENVVGAIGVDFTPSALDTERLIQIKYDGDLQGKTRLFVFDQDNLDNSRDFLENCAGGPGPASSGLPGGHLAPVFFKLAIDDLDLEDLPPEAKDMAKEAIGFQSASFGDEEHLEQLVDEVCNWVLGKPPTRGPEWNSKGRTTPPQIAGSLNE